MFWRACAAQFKFKSECAVFVAKTRCNISVICSYISVYGRQRCVCSNCTAPDLSQDDDFPRGLVLCQLFQRQEHDRFSLAENLQAAMNF